MGERRILVRFSSRSDARDRYGRSTPATVSRIHKPTRHVASCYFTLALRKNRGRRRATARRHGYDNGPRLSLTATASVQTPITATTTARKTAYGPNEDNDERHDGEAYYFGDILR